MKKKFLIFIFCPIFSFGAYCDVYLMWGIGTGYSNMAGNGGWCMFDTYFNTQYYPFDGPIGFGFDLRMKYTLIGYDYKYYEYDRYRPNKIKEINGHVGQNCVEFIACPTLLLRLFNHRNNGDGVHPVLKFFPVFAYSIHDAFNCYDDITQPIPSYSSLPAKPGVKEPCIGGGVELCLNWARSQYPTGGGEVFLMYNQNKFLETKENYFSIGFGVRWYFRKSLLDEKALKKVALEQEQRQKEYAARQEQIRQQKAQERQDAENAAIQSGSLNEMINFINQYGDSANIKLAIERYFSKDKNQPHKEIKGYDNPYSFENGSVYFCSSMSVFQWVSKYSFLAKVNGDIIYVETSDIENLGSRISYAFLKANGVFEYSSAVSSLNIVPRFTLVLF